jgi:hypothetical protein
MRQASDVANLIERSLSGLAGPVYVLWTNTVEWMLTRLAVALRKPMWFHLLLIRFDWSLAPNRAHNPTGVGSNPTPATIRTSLEIAPESFLGGLLVITDESIREEATRAG